MGGKLVGRAWGLCGRGLSLNETRCVVRPVRRRRGGGGGMILWALGFGQIWNLGRRPGIWALGGSGSVGLEGGGWQRRGPRGGVRMGCPTLLPPSLPPSLVSSLPPFACVHLLQLSVSPFTPSGSHRQQFKGSLVDDSSSGTIAASRRIRRSVGGSQTQDPRETTHLWVLLF